jgi:hypothetical protein
VDTPRRATASISGTGENDLDFFRDAFQ